MSVIDEIAAERVRQVFSEGYDESHDDEHLGGDLLAAAEAYIVHVDGDEDLAEEIWPWEPNSFKPKTTRENLIRAAALIVAEIERMDRVAK